MGKFVKRDICVQTISVLTAKMGISATARNVRKEFSQDARIITFVRRRNVKRIALEFIKLNQLKLARKKLKISWMTSTILIPAPNSKQRIYHKSLSYRMKKNPMESRFS